MMIEIVKLTEEEVPFNAHICQDDDDDVVFGVVVTE